MKIIKFRVWNGSRMDCLPTIWNGMVWNPREDREEKGAELMQFTGLQDKNGKDIYEGDILNEMRYLPNKIGSYDSIPIFIKDNAIAVGFKDGCFVAEPDSHLWGYICNYNDGLKTDYEVLGNIHENPELLNESND